MPVVTLDTKSWYISCGWLFLSAARSCCRTTQFVPGGAVDLSRSVGGELGRLVPIHGIEHEAERIGLFREETIVRELDVLGRQLAAVEGRLVVPADSVPQVEDDGRVVRLLPALGQIRFERERARRHSGADLVAHELVVDEAQRGVRLEVQGLVGVEVGRIVAADAEDAAAPGLLRADRPRRQQGR